MKTNNAILDYQLTDVLEMNFSKKSEVLNHVKSALLSRPIKDFNLYSLSSFILEDALVAIGNNDLDQIKHLYLLDAASETFKTYCIHSISRERRLSNGKKLIRSLKHERLAPA